MPFNLPTSLMKHIRDLTHIAPQDMAVLDGLMPPEWTEVWRDFGRVFYVGLLEAGLEMPRDAIAAIAIEQVYVMGHELGGQQWYIPSGAKDRSKEVERRICAEFKGNNYVELARRYGLSDSHVRKVLRMNRTDAPPPKSRAKAQNPIPDSSNSEIHMWGASHPFRGL